MSKFIKRSGFDFVKAGEFQFSQKPHKFKSWTSKLIIKLYDERYEKADETAYLIMHEEQILYVGEFTYNLKDRWLSKGHVNHHMYDNIENSLNKKQEISLWLAISPFCKVADCDELNVSKSLEQRIMREFQPKWNLRNKLSEAKEWRDKNCIKLNSLGLIPKP